MPQNPSYSSDDKRPDEYGPEEIKESKTINHTQLKQELDAFLKKGLKKGETGDTFLPSDVQPQPVKEDKKNESNSGMTFGQALIKKGYITKDQLEIALKEQRESNEKKELGTVLMELNFISDKLLAEVLADVSGIKTVDLKTYKINQEVLRKVPRDFAVQNKVVAFDLIGDDLYVASSDVYNVLVFDQIKREFHGHVRIIPFYSNDYHITEIIDQYYDYELDIFGIIKEIENGQKEYNIQDDSYVNPTVRFVDSVLTDAVKLRASDIHFEPEKEFVRLRYRIDGRLVQMISFHKQYWPAILVRLKIISGLNIAETRAPQDGRITMPLMGRKVDFRISVMPTVQGENFVARILDIKRALLPLSELGLSDEYFKLIKLLLKRPEGIIIITGPTGSGKTTTLYSMISYINSLDINIMTLEHPVEYQIPIIRQTSVREESGITFENGISTLMRQDPDVILIGEVRDKDTATMTLRAAMTGHLVFTTLHTNDAIGAIPRLADLGVERAIMAGSIICCMAQRLLRRLCPHCKIQYTATENDCIILDVDKRNPPQLFKHKGCDKCFNTGYRGTIAVYEILPIDKEIDELIALSATRKEIMNYAVTKGFKTMAEDGIVKVLSGVSDLDELINTVDLTERLKNAVL